MPCHPRSRSRWKRLLLVPIFLITPLFEASAQDLAGLELIPLRNGMNTVDLDGAGTTATVVIARRDNFNAHSTEMATFYAKLTAGGYPKPELKVITVFGEEKKHLLNISSGGGAD